MAASTSFHNSSYSAGAKGVITSLASSILFGGIYFFTPAMQPMSAESVWAVRVLFALPIITLVIYMSRELRFVREIWQRIRKQPLLLLPLAASALLLTLQLWIFSWGPLNGRGMQVALGYFLLPLVLVVVGRLLYKDKMTWWQWLAAGIALAGVLYEVLRIGGIGWETLVVAIGYPVYFVLRRTLGTGHLGGMWWDFTLILPFAIATTVWSFADGSLLAANPNIWWIAPSIALVAAFALVCYLLASRYLSLSVFGLLSYAEPALMMVAALLIGERIAPGEFITYGAIWFAVLVIIVGGASDIVRSRRKRS